MSISDQNVLILYQNPGAIAEVDYKKIRQYRLKTLPLARVRDIHVSYKKITYAQEHHRLVYALSMGSKVRKS